MSAVVRLCNHVVVRTTLDISDRAYYVAKSIARDQNPSLGQGVGDLILQSAKGVKAAKGESIEMSEYGFPIFRCAQPVTSEDVRTLGFPIFRCAQPVTSEDVRTLDDEE